MIFQSILAAGILISAALFGNEPLSLWNEGAAKTSIENFVKETTDPKSSKFIPLEDRIVVFDQDGTLWVEKPIYTQLYFALDKAKLKLSEKEISNLSEKEVVEIVTKSFSGMSVDEYRKEVALWLKTAIHPRFKRPFTELVYAPMFELMKYLQDNKFKVYIVSGGGQEFIRAYAQEVYGLPSEQIIGSAGKVRYADKKIMKLPEILYIDDKSGKPEMINLVIGKRPLAAFGNSTGDKEMLEWASSLSLLVHHDDAEREYKYGENSKIGHFPDSLKKLAIDKGWLIVSMKDDWKEIFSNDDLAH